MSEKERGCACQRCHRTYKVDFMLPDGVWGQIAEGRNLLCPVCIGELVEGRNVFDAFYLRSHTEKDPIGELVEKLRASPLHVHRHADDQALMLEAASALLSLQGWKPDREDVARIVQEHFECFPYVDVTEGSMLDRSVRAPCSPECDCAKLSDAILSLSSPPVEGEGSSCTNLGYDAPRGASESGCQSDEGSASGFGNDHRPWGAR